MIINPLVFWFAKRFYLFSNYYITKTIFQFIDSDFRVLRIYRSSKIYLGMYDLSLKSENVFVISIMISIRKYT